MVYILITHIKIIGDKRTMLNYKSKPKEVEKFMEKWQDKAEYWFVKDVSRKFGDYDSFINDMLSRSFNERRTIVGDYVKYNPQNGVNWIVCGIARYYDKVSLPYYQTCAFCYYETAASMRVYVSVSLTNRSGEEEKCGVLCYTDHFFLRMKERLGKDAGMDDIVKAFLWNVGNVVIRDNIDKDGKSVKITMKFPDDGFGFGRLIEKDGARLFNIKTFLKRSQLTPCQLRYVKELEEFEKSSRGYPKELDEMKAKIDERREELGIRLTDGILNNNRYSLCYN